MNGPNRPRRFWNSVSVEQVEGGFALRLDDRPLRTPDKAELAVPSRALADALAAEWDAQGEQVRPEDMPLTRAANVSIDRLGARHGEVVALLASYGETDLLCHRAEAPAALVERQAEEWEPWLAWAEETLNARLKVVEGVIPVPQPAESLAALKAAIAAHDRFEIAALHDMITLTGSAVLGLAVSHGALTALRAWDLSCLDETWQIEQWGADDEAAAAAARKRAALIDAHRLIDLLRQP